MQIKRAIEAVEIDEEPEEVQVQMVEAGLTKREVEVAFLVKKGCSNKEIAEELFISETTVKKHMTHIFEKLGINGCRDI